jgi:hypothetical protein
VFIRLGWEVKDHYGAHTSMIVRWLNEAGRDGLIEERAQYRRGRRGQTRAVNYVLGRRLRS